MKKILAFLLCAVLLLTVAAPAALAETMTEPTEATTVPTETTTAPTEDTTEATQAPSASATAPADPTQEPTTEGTVPETEAPTQAPTEAATTASTEAPTEETTVPTEAPAEPVETEPVEEPVIPAVNYTDVGPLLPPVTISGGPRKAPAMYAQENSDGLFMEKNAVRNEDGSVTLTMEVYTTGTVQTVTKAVPTDIILVLDESGSMKENLQEFTKVYSSDLDQSYSSYYYVKDSNGSYIPVYYCRIEWRGHLAGWYTERHRVSHGGTRYDPMTSATDTATGHVQFYQLTDTSTTKRKALQDAAKAFADKVSEDAKANNVQHRIGVASFSSGATKRQDLTDVSQDQGLTSVKSGIDNLGANGGTYMEQGLNMAINMLSSAPALGTAERKRVVIVFTDGIPGTGDWDDWNGYTEKSANDSIANAKTLKNGYGATVYTIGVVNGANPAADINYGNNNSSRLNRFLHFVSSNYPNATNLNDGGEGGNKGYYLSANNADSLNEIFQKISSEIQTPSIELDAETAVKDIIAPQFVIPEGAEVKLYTADYNGTTFGARTEAVGVTPEIKGDTLSVTGFDYTENFVSQTAKKDGTFGKKLIIEVMVQQKPGFLGGNNIATNGTESGVYDKDGKLVKNFPVPTVDVPIENVTVTVTDKNVYLLGDLTQDQLLAGSTVKCGDVVLMENGVEKPQESWQTQYVDIAYTLPEAQNDLQTDGTYTLSASVKPKTPKDGLPGKEDSAAGSIHVFLPEITWQDSLLALDATPDYMKENHVSVRWLHNGELENNMIGDRPTLSYGFTPEESKLRKETYVTVHVQIDGVDVTNKVTFEHKDCDLVDSCTFDAAKGQFLIHIGTFDLIIRKDGWKEIDENQSFLFRITGPNGFSMEVTVQGNGRKTIKGLQMGTYTVTEVTSWSWRYKCQNNDQKVTPDSVEDGSAELTFYNDRTNNSFWLNGCAFMDNVWRRENA